MDKTQLSDILTDMNSWKDIDNIEEQYKVRALDGAIRRLTRKTNFPWTLKKSTIRIFDGVLEYPTASDHQELAYIDNDKKYYAQKARFFYTSLQQFYEDVSNRNTMAEIWDSATKFLGIRYKDIARRKQVLDNAENASNYSVADDAVSVALDTVIFKEGNASIRVGITNNSNIATVKNTFNNAISLDKYNSNYHFRRVYLNAVPVSIEMRFKTDNSNYLKTVVTTQFSGQPFKANDWNLIAQDLNIATEVGTFNKNLITGDEIILNSAPTGTYYFDECFATEWELFDYWYYSSFNVASSSAVVPDLEFFGLTYDVNSYLVGEKEWADVIKFEALEQLMASVENVRLYSVIMKNKENAWNDLFARFPDMVPVVITQKYRFMNGLEDNLS